MFAFLCLFDGVDQGGWGIMESEIVADTRSLICVIVTIAGKPLFGIK